MTTHEARKWTIVRETWLTRKPSSESAWVAVVATLALALGSLSAWTWTSVSDWARASAHSVFTSHQYWRLWTTIFVHSDLNHLLSNSFLFFILAFFLFGHFGSLVFPVAALFLGGIANAFSLMTYKPEIELVGASGVVYWMGGAWLVLYFFLSRQKNTFHRAMRTFGVALLLFAPADTFQPNVSHRTHLSGFLIGVLFGVLYYWFNRHLFKSAEVVETIIDDDPEDELPPIEGLSH